MGKLPRRDAILRGVQLVSAFTVLPALAGRAQAAESCTEPSSESLRESLNYTPKTANADQPCRACGFFAASEGSCGNCMIMSGPVDATGHCDSWSPKG